MITDEDYREVSSLNFRLNALLSKTANALHGGPLQNGFWSYHDLPELAKALRQERDELKQKLDDATKPPVLDVEV